MKRMLLAVVMAGTLVALPACGERGEEAEEAEAAGEVEDSAAAAQAAEAMAAPGEEAKLVEEGEGLLARVKVSDSEARVIALTKVSGGRIAKAAIEEEDGRLVYSYILVVEAKPGVITEVLVDALTGEVVSVGEEKGGA